MKHFAGSVAVITGAGSGIGRALSLQLAQAGASLALSDWNEESLAETRKLAESRGANVLSERLDVSDREAVERHAAAVEEQLGPANLVINNAGVSLVDTVDTMSYDDLEWLMNINFYGVVHGTKSFLPQLERAQPAHLINISSLFGLIGVPTNSAYCAAKFAVRGFTESLRQELRIQKSRVRVHTVHPGGVNTNIARSGRFGDGGEELLGPRDQIVKRFHKVAQLSPERAAQIILSGAARNHPRILVGPDARFMDAISRLFPARYSEVGRFLVNMARRKKRSPSESEA